MRATGTIQLHYCGGTSVSGGWQGSSYFHPDTVVPAEIQRHSVAVSIGPGINVTIETGAKPFGGNPLHPGDTNACWRTAVMADFRDPATGLPTSEVLAEWYNDADPDWDAANPTLTPPGETITVTFDVSVDAEEWATEAFDPATLRPADPRSIDMALRMKPTGNTSALLTWSGGGTTVTAKPNTSVQASRFGYLSESISKLGTDPTPDPDSAWGMAVFGDSKNPFPTDLPYPNARFGEASGLSLLGPLSWYGEDGGGFSAPSTAPAGASAFRFTAASPGTVHHEVVAVPDYTITVNGIVRDWNNILNNVPVAFGRGDSAPYYSFSGSRRVSEPVVEPVISGSWLFGHGYNGFDAPSAVIREGPAFSVLSMSRAASLDVLDFTVSPPGHDWTATACTTSVVGGDLQAVGSSSGSPQVTRMLRNDLLEMEPNPAAWWTAHASEVPVSALNWYHGAAGGPTLTTDGPGEWFRVGKKLRPDSDVFNWSSFRYADLTAKADAPCDVTLTLDWDDTRFDASLTDPLIRGARTASYTVSLTTSMAAHEIDLPGAADAAGELVGHGGLRCLRAVTVSFPAGRTVTLSKITLKGKGPVTVDVHMAGDNALLSALGDGKQVLCFSNARPPDRPTDYPSSVWGFPCYVRAAGDGDDRSASLASQLAAEISLQEGWSATPGGGPGAGNPNYSINLSEVFGSSGGLQGRRAYGSIVTVPKSGYTLDLEANLGSAMPLLCYDPDTHTPVSTVVSAYTLGPDQPIDTTTTDALGKGRLEATDAGPVELRSSPGTAEERIYPPMLSTLHQPVTLASRTWWAAAFLGKAPAPVGGAGPLVLDIDRSGNAWVSEVRSGQLYVDRRLSAWAGPEQAAWESLPVGATASGSWIHIDETSPEMAVRVVFGWGADTVYQATSRENGTGGWALATIGTGTHPFIRKQKSTGITYYLFWRDGSVWLKRSPDDGASFLGPEVEVLSSAVESTYTLDFRLDPSGTVELPYSDGTDIKSRISTDNGATWIDG